MTKHVILLLALFITASCNLYPGGDVRSEELDVVLTYGDDQVDFKQMATYALLEEVRELEVDGALPSFTLSQQAKDAIIKAIQANLAAYGWQLVDTSESPDLVLGIGVAVTSHTNIYANFPGYGWGYPYFAYTASTYPVGTLVLVAVDEKRKDPVTDISPTVWLSIIQGPLTKGVTDQPARIDRDITQAFTQSAYLNLNP